jgi:large subunit ribosomal protein L17
MRHSKHKNTISKREGHRKALFNNLAIALIQNNRITTTLNKAKIASQFTDKMITIAKKNDLAARRELFTYLKSRELVKYVVDELAPRFANRNGGYTRVIKYKNRMGDNALLAIVEFTEIPEVVKEKPKAKKEKKEKPAAKEKADVSEKVDSEEAKKEDKSFFNKIKKNLKKK